MKLDNKGYTLVITLIIFSIIISISAMCIEIVSRNAKYTDLEYKEMILMENAKSSVELLESNILKEIQDVENIINSSEEFIEYFQGNEFIKRIENIENSNIKNLSVNITSRQIVDNNIQLKVEGISKIDKYSKRVSCYIYINNPFGNEEYEEKITIKDMEI